MVLAYVVYYGVKPLAVYVDRDQAEWCAFMLGRHAKIKKFSSSTLLKMMK